MEGQSSSSRKRKQLQPQKLSFKQAEERSYNLADVQADLQGDSKAEILPPKESTRMDTTPIVETAAGKRKKVFIIEDESSEDEPEIIDLAGSDDSNLEYKPGYNEKKSFARTPKKPRRTFSRFSGGKTVQTASSLVSKEKAEVMLATIHLGLEKFNVPLALEQKIIAEINNSEVAPNIKFYLENRQEVGSSTIKVDQLVLTSFIRLAKKGEMGFDVNIKELTPLTLNINFYLMAPIFKAVSPMAKIEKSLENNLKIVLPWLRPDIHNTLVSQKSEESRASFFDSNELFESIKPPKTEPTYQSPQGLLPTLRPYQKRAIEWMLKREAEPEINWNLHPLWKEFKGADEKIFSMNPHTGALSTSKFYEEQDIKGGILADEMGLGKTIEVLSLVMSHPNPEPESGGTLIVCPSSIIHQWKEEIERHTKRDALNVKIYAGVKNEWISAKKLRSFDVVLTTFDALRGDLSHTNVETGYSFRNEKRYKVKPTPLIAVNWWRVVIDECQMVESTTAKAAEMALHLKAVNRWCVSGTPIQKGLEDLYGLFLFLKINPYSDRLWWNKVLQEPYESKTNRAPLIDVLKRVLWRNSKLDVMDELKLPTQHERIINLEFSPVEAYFYKKQYEECNNKFHLQLTKWATSRKQDFSKLVNPLLQIRQACCHPQVGSKGIRTLQRNTMTMDELLDQLLVKAKVECEEAMRAVILSGNGLAGIHLLEKLPEKAVDEYLKVLSVIEKNKAIDADKLQRIHTLFNLALVMKDLGRKEIDFNDHKLTLEDVLAQEREIRNEYLKVAENGSKILYMQVEELESSYDKEISSMPKREQFWFESALELVDKNSAYTRSFMEKMKDELSKVASMQDFTSKYLGCRKIEGIQFALNYDVSSVKEMRGEVLRIAKELHRAPTTADIDKFLACQCWKSKASRGMGGFCDHCKAENLILEYESKLFWSSSAKQTIFRMDFDENFADRQVSKEEHRGRVTESEFEKVLKVLVSFMKTIGKTEIAEIGQKHLETVEILKNECKKLKLLGRKEREVIAVTQELQMCTERMQIRQPSETVQDLDKNYRILSYEVEPRKMRFITDKGVAELKLRQAQSQLQYLKNLQKDKTEAEKEICPVCTDEVGPHRVILVCGHTLCEECTMAIIRHAKKETIKCPTCRTRVNINEVSYIMDTLANGNKKEEEKRKNEIPVQGSYGSKLEAVIRQVMVIEKEDKGSKVLIFSEWNDVLEIISRALSENRISFVRVERGRNWQKGISSFKIDPTIRVMLLPVKSGGNGLNLIEASHVILVEPMLNPAYELQAINRVHRIGQEKETYIYRFIIKGTIEEKIHEISKTKKIDWKKRTEKQEITLEEIKTIFTLTPLNIIDNNDSQETHTEVCSNPIQNKFWNAGVQYHNTIVPRNRLVRQLELILSWECKEEGKNISELPKTIFMGMALSEEVLKRLLTYPSTEEETEEVWKAIKEMKLLLGE